MSPKIPAAIPAKKMYEPQNGVTEGSPGEGSPGRGNAPLGKKDLAGIAEIPRSFIPDFPLKKLTTFSVGGPARYFIEIKQLHDMQKTLAYCYA